MTKNAVVPDGKEAEILMNWDQEEHYSKQFSTNNIYREHCNKADGKKGSY